MSRDHLTSVLYPRHGARQDSLRVYAVPIKRHLSAWSSALHLLNPQLSPRGTRRFARAVGHAGPVAERGARPLTTR